MTIQNEAPADGRRFQDLMAAAKNHLARNQSLPALPLLQEALAINPRAIDARLYLGAAYLHLNNFAEAERHLIQAHQAAPSANTLFYLGQLRFLTRRYDDALAFFAEAIKLNPNDTQSWAFIGQTYYMQDKRVHAILVFHKLARENPKDITYKNQLSIAMRDFTPVKFDPALRDAALLCLETDGLSHDHLNQFFTGLVALDPDFAVLRAGISAPDYQSFKAEIADTDLKGLQSPLLLNALGAFIIGYAGIEQALTYARRYMLEASSIVPFTPFLAALAAQCFLTEYVFDEDATEAKAVDALITHLASQTVWTPENAAACMLLAAYRPLADIADAWPLTTPDNIMKSRAFAGLQALLEGQINDIRRERAIKDTIPVWGRMQDETSALVRAMYEENPYPRWKNVYTEKGDINPAVDMASIRKNAPQGLKVLVAGCGTGRHAIFARARFPDAHITAIDLSLASLAFAKRRCDELGLTNIDFAQADMLDLAGMDMHFDVIECAGVLHHMKDPMAGWKALEAVLKPSGVMRIGLYSEAARQDVVACRTFIAQNGFEATTNGIRACRAAIRRLPDIHPAKPIMTTSSFYSTSQCRDLIFHVQEHRFTIPQIKACLDTLGLTFTAFSLGNFNVERAYRQRYPDDKTLSSLENWDAFERQNPYAFRGMYQFWCRKADPAIERAAPAAHNV